MNFRSSSTNFKVSNFLSSKSIAFTLEEALLAIDRVGYSFKFSFFGRKVAAANSDEKLLNVTGIIFFGKRSGF